MDESLNKVCFSCKQEKPVSHFHSAKNRPDGRYPYCKECCKQKLAERAKRNPDQEAERRKAKRAYDAKRYKENAAPIRQRVADRYAANAGAVKAYVRKWQAKNKDAVRAYKATNKHKRRATERNGVSGRALLQWVREQVKSCYWCGANCSKAFHVDHYTPLAKGGEHELSNLVIACPGCNLKKNAKDPLDFAKEVGRLF